MDVGKDKLIEMYRSMQRIRQFESKIRDLATAGEVPGFVHVSIGEEASATGVCAALRPTDRITSTHRGHGHLLAELNLSTRHWTCPACRAPHDRDLNAAKNILAAGLAVAREAPGDACGADVRHSGSSRVQSAAKQEPRPATAGIPVPQGGE